MVTLILGWAQGLPSSIHGRRAAIWLAVFLVVLASTATTDRAFAVQRPNIVMISIDDQNDWIGAIGGSRQAITPNLDRLARQGIMFENAQTPSPLCNTSRAAVLSGVSPLNFGGYQNTMLPTSFRSKYPQLRWITTLPQFLKERGGYVIKTSGKLWHEDYTDLKDSVPDLKPGDPNDPGRAFTEFDEVFNNGNSFDDPKRKYIGQPGFNPDKGGPSDDFNGSKRSVEIALEVPGSDLEVIAVIPTDAAGKVDRSQDDRLNAQMKDTKVANWAANEVMSHNPSEGPLYVQAGLFRPHLPWEVPVQFLERFPLDQVQVPEHLANDLNDIPAAGVRIALPKSKHGKMLALDGEKGWRRLVRGYLASMYYTDTNVGTILEAVEKRVRSHPQEDWLVVLWSDHGFHLGEKEKWGKWSLWEESGRAPLMVWWPGRFEGGKKVNLPVNLLDIFPTLTDLAGVPTPPQVQGRTLSDLLKSPRARKDDYVVMSRQSRELSVRSKDWRYIRYPDGKEELYDHRKDPNEWDNLLFGASAVNYEQERRRLASELYRWSVRVRDLNYFGSKGSQTLLASIPTLGHRWIDEFGEGSGSLDQRSGWTTRKLGQGGQDFKVNQKRLKAPGGAALSTVDNLSRGEKDSFLLSALVDLGSRGGSAGLVFGYQDLGNYDSVELTAVSGGRVGVQVKRRTNGRDQVLFNRPRAAGRKGEQHLLVAEYSRAADTLEVIVFNNAGVGVFRQVVDLGRAVPKGSGFGITAEGGSGATLDFVTMLSWPRYETPAEVTGDQRLQVKKVNLPVRGARGKNLIDGKLATSWVNDGKLSNAWYQLDLGKSHELSKVALAPQANRNFIIEVFVHDELDDRGSVKSRSTIRANGQSELISIDLPKQTKGRFVTIVSVNRAWMKVYESALWGRGADSSESRHLQAVRSVVPVKAVRGPNLVDGNQGSYWSNDGHRDSAWFSIDLGAQKTLTELKLAPKAGASYQVDVHVHDREEVRGTPVLENITLSAASQVKLLTKMLPPGTTGRWVTVKCSKAWFKMHEAEVWGY